MMTIIAHFTSGILAALTFATVSTTASAQDFPSKSVTIVVPLAAGSGVDLVSRVYGEQLGNRLGRPVVVENRTGAATMIGTNYVATSPPDGHKRFDRWHFGLSLREVG